MAAVQVHPGYKGIAVIQGINEFRYQDAAISARQAIEAPDLIMGDWDHDAYVYGKVEVGGTMSGPVTEGFANDADSVWGWATTRSDCGLLEEKNVDIYYYCGEGTNHRTFGGMLVNSIGFSVTAGEVAQFNLDLMGKDASTLAAATPPEFRDAERLITWDKCSVTIDPGPDGDAPPDLISVPYSAFDFTLNNNLQPAYSLNQGITTGLFPIQIVPGLRSISGTLTVYNTPAAEGFKFWDDYTPGGVSTITFQIGPSLTVDMKVRFHRIEPRSSVGLITSTVGFTGVTHQTTFD